MSTSLTVVSKSNRSSSPVKSVKKSSGSKLVSQNSSVVHPVSLEARHKMISENAYFRAQQRNFDGDVGSADEDWFAAEDEIDERFRFEG